MTHRGMRTEPPVLPMPSRPYRCPVCMGKGIVPLGFYSFGPTIPSTSTNASEKCRSCGGTGVVRA